MYDVIVIGAGPAGLQAALTLGRMHRRTLLLDSGEYRNKPVAHMHNVLGADGMPPAEFRATAREQLRAYRSVEFATGRVERVEGEADEFRVVFPDGCTESARRIVLATGLADDLPEVAGLEGLWGRRAFACPFCDGHEFSGARIGVIGAGPAAAHVLALLRPIVDAATVFAVGEPTRREDRAEIERHGGTVHDAPVTAVRAHRGGVRVTAGEDALDVAGLFVAGGAFRQRAPFAAQLGLRMLPSGAIEIDEFGRTSVTGVSAAGDLAHRASLPGPMASVMLAAAAGQVAASWIVQELSL